MSPLTNAFAGTMVLLAAEPAVPQPINLRPPPPVVLSAPVSPPAPVGSAPALVRPPPAPPATYALLPGHWQLRGARSVWVPPETRLRRVETRPFVPGRYVWRDGRWIWVPSHYANSAGE